MTQTDPKEVRDAIEKFKKLRDNYFVQGEPWFKTIGTVIDYAQENLDANTPYLDEHDLTQFLTGWGINQASKLSKDIIARFGGVLNTRPAVAEVSTAGIEDVISKSDLWKHQVTRTGLQRDKRHLAQAIHSLLTQRLGGKP